MFLRAQLNLTAIGQVIGRGTPIFPFSFPDIDFVGNGDRNVALLFLDFPDYFEFGGGMENIARPPQQKL